MGAWFDMEAASREDKSRKTDSGVKSVVPEEKIKKRGKR